MFMQALISWLFYPFIRYNFYNLIPIKTANLQYMYIQSKSNLIK
jgi:hypothetical protein